METMPDLLAKVRLIRNGKVYLVVDVDERIQRVELLSTTGIVRLVPDVPFAAIHELVEEPPDYL